ncbi:hypothetical protein BDF19DRAFT_435833 [Syncephalis fuscata]|nr:hypothetical protein BDF19DRAFT_435833 [Syncephalis fuscata]
MKFSLPLTAVLLASAASLVQSAPGITQPRNIRLWWAKKSNQCLQVIGKDPKLYYNLASGCNDSYWTQTPIPAENPVPTRRYYTLKERFSKRCLAYDPKPGVGGYGTITTAICNPNAKNQHWELPQINLDDKTKGEYKLVPRIPRYGTEKACVGPIRFAFNGAIEYKQCNHTDRNEYYRLEVA